VPPAAPVYDPRGVRPRPSGRSRWNARLTRQLSRFCPHAPVGFLPNAGLKRPHDRHRSSPTRRLSGSR
jgi:hypothetical protein